MTVFNSLHLQLHLPFKNMPSHETKGEETQSDEPLKQTDSTAQRYTMPCSNF